MNRFEGPSFSYDNGTYQSGPHLLWVAANAQLRPDDFSTFVLTPRVFSDGPVATHGAWALADSRGGGVYDPNSPPHDFLLMTASRVQFPTIALLMVQVVVLATVAAWRALRIFRQSKRFKDGFCINCGYDLQATPDRCPECGTITQKTGLSPALKV